MREPLRQVIQWLLFLVCSVGLPAFVWAECSSQLGKAVINEVANDKSGSIKFVEIKILDFNFLETPFYSIQICADTGRGRDKRECESPGIAATVFNPNLNSRYPWLVFEAGSDFSEDLLDFKNGFSIALRDSGQDPIDVLRVNGYSAGDADECAEEIIADKGVNYTDISGTNNGTNFIQRSPDGTGDWLVRQGNNEDETPGENNDSGPVEVDHYGIYVNGQSDFSDSTGLTCEAATVTLVAHDAGDSPSTPGDGVSVTLSTSTGEGFWSSADSGLTNTGGGTATYSFSGVNDFATFYLNHTSPGLVNIDVTVSGNSVQDTNEDPDIVFYDSGFRFIDGVDNALSVANGFVPTAGAISNTFYLQAVRKDTDTQACVGLFGDGSDHKVDLAAECIDPVSCRGGQVTLRNNGNSYTVATNDGAPGYTNDMDVRFGVDSKAAFTLNYPDVGAIKLHARHDILLQSGADSGVDMLGSSAAFVVKPADLVITSVPGNTGSEGVDPGFKAAGELFTVRVDARNAQNNPTPNFGREVSPHKVIMNFDALSYPTGGVDGVLSEGSFTLTATDGLLEATDVEWSEVGTFTAYASIKGGDYLNAGDVTGTTSGNIGRFYPDHFTLDISSLTNSCGSFSYLSQPNLLVDYTLTANRVGGGRVTNYDNTTLAFPAATITHVAEQNNNGLDLSSRLTVAATGWVNGEYMLNDPAASLARTTGLESPMDAVALGLKISDVLDSRDFDTLDMNASTTGDCLTAVDCDARELSGTLNLRFGRLFTRDVHGPESNFLPVVLQAEYWNGSNWQLNTDDSCSSFGRDDIDFAGTAIINNADLQVAMGSGSTTGSFLSLSPTDITLIGGDAGLSFSAPGSGNTGSFPVSVDTSSMPWLWFDWDQDGFHDDLLPEATVSFGSYRGHDRVIYWQERLAD